jgi:hypothetical protein
VPGRSNFEFEHEDESAVCVAYISQTELAAAERHLARHRIPKLGLPAFETLVLV